MSNVFRFEELDGNVGLLTFDTPGKKVNTLSLAAWDELGKIFRDLAGRSDLNGLLLKSGKPGQFIAGAHLKELGMLAQAPRAMISAAIDQVQGLMKRIGELRFPTVALIDGNCFGGGTELTLAMDYRIASDSRSTKIGLPEVKLGVIPGWGGTQRLPRLCGINAAIEMICSGAEISAEKSAALGLVFDTVPAERLIEEGCRLIEHVRSTDQWTKDRQRRQQPLGLSEDQMHFAFAVAEGFLKGKTGDHYPAPIAALRSIREGINRPLPEALEIEREIVLDVLGSPVAANLIAVFFMDKQLSRNPGLASPASAPAEVKRAGVLGAGLMGAGIATAFARRGLPTVMVDVDHDRLAAGMSSARKVVESRMKIGRATPDDMYGMLAVLSTSTSHQMFADCDVVVEAVTENESLKTSLYKQLVGVLRDDAILASNTSTISITRMAESVPNPERFGGMHFFSPVDRMALVEVIRGEKTSDETAATLVELARRAGKKPIVVNDCPGFLVNRILLPYMSEALLMLLEGASMNAVDKVAVNFGMPVGPVALYDLVGIDTACFAGNVLAQASGDRAVKSSLLENMLEAGLLGKKSGAGFRKFVGKKAKPVENPEFKPILEKNRIDNRKLGDEEIQDRLFLSMLLEATRALEDGIVSEPAHVDMGLILGIGFPPFRGGILRWCEAEGPGKMLDRVAKYTSLGQRFEPTETLMNMAKSGTAG